ncbi:hypothetical protein GIB67_040094 [Kingdonia uniflora]|uniref:Protein DETOXIFICATION n=1 Tax=Kingdonia uniflora TaxID=39325 RepID=A0A7J7MUX4_9MAGN|nr:hypothetical protein GIB67_040094 [Kingdonia uniflora]
MGMNHANSPEWSCLFLYKCCLSYQRMKVRDKDHLGFFNRGRFAAFICSDRADEESLVPIMAEELNVNLPERKKKTPFRILFKDARHVFRRDAVGWEIASIAFPAALALTADPIASLIDTAFIGHIGPVELAAVGVSIAVFNQFSRITIFPLVSMTTSFVAEEDTINRLNIEENESSNLEKGLPTNCEMKDLSVEADSDKAVTNLPIIEETPKAAEFEPQKRNLASASSALVFGGLLGILQALVLILAAKPILSFMGVKSDSPMLTPALQYLTLRSFGSPAILLSLAMQGVFRGFKDTKTPLYATVVGDVTNIILDPIFIFVLKMGVSGAAIAHIISQYILAIILLWRLMKKINLVPPSIKALQFSRFLRNGSMLMARVIAVTFCVTLAASLAARLGPTPMAAFQICLQIWLATSLLADGLAVAGQAMLATAFAEKDYEKASATTSRVLQLGLVLGVALAVFVGLGLGFGAKIFTRDVKVLHLISIGIPILVAIVSIVSLFLLSHSHGFLGIWIALTIYMSLRAIVGFWRIGTGTGPWRFLRG